MRMVGPQGGTGRVRKISLTQGFDAQTIRPTVIRYKDSCCIYIDRMFFSKIRKLSLFSKYITEKLICGKFDLCQCQFIKIEIKLYIYIYIYQVLLRFSLLLCKVFLSLPLEIVYWKTLNYVPTYSSQVLLTCQLLRHSWHYKHYLLVITRKFPRRSHLQLSTCHSEENHRLSPIGVHWPGVIVVFHSYWTKIMTIISADQHSAVYWTPTLYQQTSTVQFTEHQHYISRPTQCSLLNNNIIWAVEHSTIYWTKTLHQQTSTVRFTEH
jgi:hypothetical protein